MAKSNFENLQVYQLAEKLADDIWNIAFHGEEFPKATIGKQIVRFLDSVLQKVLVGIIFRIIAVLLEWREFL
jgi:hypothetical protein